ncbi:MAG: LuxR C-terminal-related transcriptional regulator [Bacillota bacterium]
MQKYIAKFKQSYRADIKKSFGGEAFWFILVAGSFFAWVWSLIVYAPTLIPLSVIHRAPPTFFQIPLLCALVASLLLWPHLMARWVPKTEKAPLTKKKLIHLLSNNAIIPVAAAVAAALSTASLAFLPPKWWIVPGAISGTAAGIIWTPVGLFPRPLPLEKISASAGWIMFFAAVFHLPIAATAGVVPPLFLVFITALLPLVWMLPQFNALQTSKLGSNVDLTSDDRHSSKHKKFNIKKWVVIVCAILFVYLASFQIFGSLQQYAALPPEAWGSVKNLGFFTHEGQIYLPLDLLGIIGTVIYGLAALSMGCLALRVTPERLFFWALVLSGLAVAVFALVNNLATAALSFVLLQGALASVDVFFWIVVMVLIRQQPQNTGRITGTALTLYALAGFAPPVFIQPDALMLPHSFLSAVIFLLAAITLIDALRTYNAGGLLPDINLLELWGDSVSIYTGNQIDHSWETIKTLPIGKLMQLLDEYGLTVKEKQIVAMLLQGLSPLEIAQQCHISKNTLKTHMRNLLRKTGNANAKELIIWVLKNNRES